MNVPEYTQWYIRSSSMGLPAKIAVEPCQLKEQDVGDLAATLGRDERPCIIELSLSPSTLRLLSSRFPSDERTGSDGCSRPALTFCRRPYSLTHERRRLTKKPPTC